MIEQPNRRLRNRARSFLGTSALLIAFALPQTASAVFELGGIDAESQYTGAGKTDGFGDPLPDAGILTFDDDLNGWVDAAPGLVTSGTVGITTAILGIVGITRITFTPMTVFAVFAERRLTPTMLKVSY